MATLKQTSDGTFLKGNQYEYKTFEGAVPQYVKHRIVPTSGSQTVTVAVATSVDSTFEIPANEPINLSKTVMPFKYVETKGVVGYTFQKASPWAMVQSIQLQTRAGQNICDIPNVNYYLHNVHPRETPFDDFITRDEGQGTSPCDCLGAVNPIITKVDGKDTNATSIGSKPYTGIKHWIVSESKATKTVYFKYCLGDIKNTIFSLDKTLYFPQPLVLRITWAPTNNCACDATANDTPYDANSVSIASGTLSDLEMHLAIDKNPKIRANLEKEVKEGKMEIMIPYVLSHKVNTGGAVTAFNMSYTMSQGVGRKLKRVYFTNYNNTQTIYQAFCNGNKAISAPVSRMTSYYTQMNGNRNQEFDLTTVDNKDYEANLPFIKGSAIQNSNMHGEIFCHIDDYTSFDPDVLKNSVIKDNVDVGLPLTGEVRWDAICTTPSAQYNFYAWFIVSRRLVFDPIQGVIMKV